MVYSIDPQNPLPRYYQVYQSLKERIESGEFEVDTALPPERQLVVDYNVSRITIVKALDTLENEGIIRREHGRGTFVNAPAPAVHESSIAFLSGVMLHPSIYRVLMGAARVTSESGYNLSVIGLHNDGLDIDFALNQIESQGIAGVLTYPRPGKKDIALYRAVQQRGIPLVMIDRYYEEMDADYVVFEEERASYEMTRHLIQRGHERIAFLTHYEVDASSIHNRIRGYRKALEEEDRFHDDLIWLDIYADLHISRGQIGHKEHPRRLRERLLAENVTALVAVNHDVAERLNYDLIMIDMDSARDAIDRDDTHGYQPMQIEIAGFGYNNLLDFSSYTVVTGLQVSDDLGKAAAELLIGRLNGDITGATRQIRIPVPMLYPVSSERDTDRVNANPQDQVTGGE